jgi:hypothetical protein
MIEGTKVAMSDTEKLVSFEAETTPSALPKELDEEDPGNSNGRPLGHFECFWQMEVECCWQQKSRKPRTTNVEEVFKLRDESPSRRILRC